MIDQWKAVLSKLSMRQRITIATAVVLVVVVIFGLTRWRHERDFRPLYSGMSAEDAGAVVAKLKELGVEFRVSDDGSTVLASAEKQAELRLALANAGLPKSGRIGFELFDKTNLGMTDFAEQVNYRRAIEGELERSIRSIAEIEQARVHLTFPKDSVFLESRTPAKASVLVTLRTGAKLSQQNILGITHMVASAVEGLTSDAVAVMDVHGTLLTRRNFSQERSDLSDEAIEYRRGVERDLLAKINTTLEPLLGPDKFRAGVSVECDFTSGEQSEESYDPERSVMASSQKTEETSSNASNSGGVPGTATNLPRPTGRVVSGPSSSARRSETIAFQTSKTVRRIRIPQGAIKRISASVLLDQAVHWDGAGQQQHKVVTPPSPETMRAIKVLVSGVLGLQPDRGDQLVVETLPFESTLQTGPPMSATPAQPQPGVWGYLQSIDPKLAVGIGAGGLFVFAAIILTLRRLKRKRAKVTGTTAIPAGEATLAVVAADTDDVVSIENRAAEIEEANARKQIAKRDKLVSSVKGAVKDDPSLVASVVRTWMEER